MNEESRTASGWQARLRLHYRREGERTVAHDLHHGPLRVLKPLHAEGPGIVQHVLVHPPGGLAGGDTLDVDVTVDTGAHAQLTTAGATRFYRSLGAESLQRTSLALQAGARLEWLPLEAIAYPGCIAANRLRLSLAEGAEMIGWDVLALGLPASGAPFGAGCFTQDLEIPGRWIERGRIEAGDRRLLDSPLGLAGHSVLALLWFAAGSALDPGRRERLLQAARDATRASALADFSGATAPEPGVVVLRVLAHRVEPAMQLLIEAWAAWRQQAWSLPAVAPRVWRT